VEYNKQRLHKVSYFWELLSASKEVPPSIRPLLKLSRETIERCQKTEYALVSSLQRDPVLADRIKRAQNRSWRGSDRGTDVGAGDRRCLTLPLDQECD
jgi:hypothetical protein